MLNAPEIMIIGFLGFIIAPFFLLPRIIKALSKSYHKGKAEAEEEIKNFKKD